MFCHINLLTSKAEEREKRWNWWGTTFFFFKTTPAYDSRLSTERCISAGWKKASHFMRCWDSSYNAVWLITQFQQWTQKISVNEGLNNNTCFSLGLELKNQISSCAFFASEYSRRTWVPVHTQLATWLEQTGYLDPRNHKLTSVQLIESNSSNVWHLQRESKDEIDGVETR